MSVQISTKSEVKADIKLDTVSASSVDLQAQVDEAIKLLKLLGKANAAAKSIDSDYKSVVGPILEDANLLFGDEDSFVLQGTLQSLEFGPKANKVDSIDKAKLIEILGVDTFLEIAVVGVGDIRKYLNPKQLAQVLDESHSGPRRIKIQ